MKRHRLGSEEINLTPLLDVLFVILFVVMLGGMQNEKTIRTEMENEVARLQDQIESYELYEEERQIITLSIQVNGQDRAIVMQTGAEEEPKTIPLKKETRKYQIDHLERMITDYLTHIEDQPVYIVFHHDDTVIYNEEYTSIDKMLRSLVKKYKEVFYKEIKEGVEENE
jgi:biopolymer transport protein ExbD